MEKLPNRPLLLDGATGTRLMAAGMPQGVCPEAWILEHPEVIREIQRGYVEAGSEILYAPTFGANPLRLAAFGLEDQMERMNRELVSLAKEASAGKALVAGDLSTAGVLPEPFGELPYGDLVAYYETQAAVLRDAGVDLLGCETFTSLSDARAALLGARKTGLPVMVSISADETGRTMMGSEALAGLIVLQSLGAAAFGLNCGEGPERMLPALSPLFACANIPLIAKPNAGVPVGRPPHYDLSPEEFAAGMEKLLAAGATVAGGCCGTDNRHIALLRRLMDRFNFPARKPPETETLAAPDEKIPVSDGQRAYFLEKTFRFSAEIACGADLDDALIDAAEEPGDAALIRIASPEEARLFAQSAHLLHKPAAFLAENEEALAEALFLYPGRAILDSRSRIDGERLAALAAEYGAVVR
ncbi:MAG TPA: homocysteine S-methyltransferase family protein [Oscillospiraceae bacterium]|nr:homocysteine S-methyltransferase family protein [Oscillospiraceae bacterium]HRW57073.1 homocysteine S-methyltransferase family protein [Oscillospiraceae bacterium]